MERHTHHIWEILRVANLGVSFVKAYVLNYLILKKSGLVIVHPAIVQHM